jgi:hypothetical protein
MQIFFFKNPNTKFALTYLRILETVTALCNHKMSSIFTFVPLGSPFPGSLPAVATEAPEVEGEADAAEADDEDGVTSEEEGLAGKVDSLSLVR